MCWNISESQPVRRNLIRIGNGMDGAAGNPRCHHTGGDIVGDYTAGPNDRSLADGNTAADHGVGADSDVVFQRDGL